MSFIIDRFTKCRVADGVYKDEGEVDKVGEEEKKKYALFKIIDFIKKYKKEREIQGEAMDKLKNITNRCDSIIEKWFDLPDYLFKQKVTKQTYHDLHIDTETFKNNTFEEFFQQNGLLNKLYINEDEAIIFKLSSYNEGREYNVYIRLSSKPDNMMNNPTELLTKEQEDQDQDQDQEQEQESSIINIFEIDLHIDFEKKKSILFKYVLKNEECFKIFVSPHINRQHNLDATHYNIISKISINNEKLAKIFNNKKTSGGIGKKTIKNKSKPLKNTILQKKEILGKDMRIYKINGSKKEYVKYKGNLISVSDYKNIIKLKKI